MSASASVNQSQQNIISKHTPPKQMLRSAQPSRDFIFTPKKNLDTRERKSVLPWSVSHQIFPRFSAFQPCSPLCRLAVYSIRRRSFTRGNNPHGMRRKMNRKSNFFSLSVCVSKRVSGKRRRKVDEKLLEIRFYDVRWLCSESLRN